MAPHWAAANFLKSFLIVSAQEGLMDKMGSLEKNVNQNKMWWNLHNGQINLSIITFTKFCVQTGAGKICLKNFFNFANPLYIIVVFTPLQSEKALKFHEEVTLF